MRFLADESCDFAVVRALRAEGHDVLAVSEFQQRSIDEEVMQLAAAENRVLLTEDKDFGRIALASEPPSVGVILIRFPASARGSLADSVCSLIREHGARIAATFIVLRPGAARIRSRTE
jgi:predicted nuclease of predicted toxin-antitoxin system